MTNLRSIFTLLILLSLLVGVNLVLRYGARERKATGRQTLVEDLDGVCRITLERKEQVSATLERHELKWRLVKPYVGSVDDQVVMRFVDVLSTTPITDVIGDSALLKLGRTRGDFSLDEPSLSIVLEFSTGGQERLDFGSKTPLTNGVYVSVSGTDSVFVVPVDLMDTIDVKAEQFRRRSVFTIGANSVAAFGIKRRAEPVLEFTRADAGWRVKGGQASSQKVSDFLAKVTAATAESFVWPVGASNETEHASAALLVGYGLDPDAAVTVTLKGVDGLDRRISFGKEVSDGRVYALVHGGAAIVTLPIELKTLADQDADSFADLRLFPSDSRSVVSFSILDRDVLYAFVREKDGNWALESPVVARANDDAVNVLLARILSLSVSDGASAGDSVAIALSTSAKKTVVSRASVFEGMKPEELRSKEIMRINPTLVKRIVRIGGREAKPASVVYNRESKGWNLENGGADAVPDLKGIEAVLSAINPLPALRVEKLKVSAADLDDYGLDSPFLTVAIDQEAGEAVRRNVIIGKKTKGGRFATIGSSDAVFVLDEREVMLLSSDIVGK